jgi:hypothetical protein
MVRLGDFGASSDQKITKAFECQVGMVSCLLFGRLGEGFLRLLRWALAVSVWPGTASLADSIVH